MSFSSSGLKGADIKTEHVPCGICKSILQIVGPYEVTTDAGLFSSRRGEPICKTLVCDDCFQAVVTPTRAYIIEKVKERAEIIAKQRAEEAARKARADIVTPFVSAFPTS